MWCATLRSFDLSAFASHLPLQLVGKLSRLIAFMLCICSRKWRMYLWVANGIYRCKYGITVRRLWHGKFTESTILYYTAKTYTIYYDILLYITRLEGVNWHLDVPTIRINHFMTGNTMVYYRGNISSSLIAFTSELLENRKEMFFVLIIVGGTQKVVKVLTWSWKTSFHTPVI